MLVDGKAIASDILNSVALDVAKLGNVPRLAAITCAPNFETQKYLQMKRLKATSVGVVLKVIELPVEATTKEVIDCVKQVAKESDGIVIQLPFPKQINLDEILSEIPSSKDPDGFCYGVNDLACMPPVVGAIDEISLREKLIWKDKQVIILGMGRLVGAPAAQYARRSGAIVNVLTKETYNEKLLLNADIIVSGIGQPHFIKSSMIKRGVVIFDAGTSEEGGVLVGDVDPQVADKAALITPVPGGIGPITIACLLRNLVQLVR